MMNKFRNEYQYLQQQNQCNTENIQTVVLDIATLEDEQREDSDENSFLNNEENPLQHFEYELVFDEVNNIEDNNRTIDEILCQVIMDNRSLHQRHRRDDPQAAEKLTPFLPDILLLFLSAFVSDNLHEHPQEDKNHNSTTRVDIYIIVGLGQIGQKLPCGIVGEDGHEPSIDSLPEIIKPLEVLFLLQTFHNTQYDEHEDNYTEPRNSRADQKSIVIEKLSLIAELISKTFHKADPTPIDPK